MLRELTEGALTLNVSGKIPLSVAEGVILDLHVKESDKEGSWMGILEGGSSIIAANIWVIRFPVLF